MVGVILAILLTPTSIMIMESSWEPSGNYNLEDMKNDEVAPVSFLESSPTFLLHREFAENLVLHVEWGAIDNPKGTGIKYYDVQYKMEYIGNEDRQTIIEPIWIGWLMNTTEMVADLTVSTDHIYYFRVRAVDNSENMESWPKFCDAISVVKCVLDDTYQELVEYIQDRKDDKDSPPGDIDIPKPQDKTSPASRVKPLFPVHFWISGWCWPADNDIVSIQVVPYPPSYYIYDWLYKKGIISTGNAPSFMVSWTGQANPAGSGIESYDVQFKRHYSMILDPTRIVPMVMPYWEDWQTETNDTKAEFIAGGDMYYEFKCRAKDYAGNTEDYPIVADTSILVIDLRTW